MRRRDLVPIVGYGLAASFALVGVLFLAVPADVLSAVNHVGTATGLPRSPLAGHGFYLALAVAYMYLVTVLAVLMARHPEDPAYATLLVHAKAVSSLLSLLLFAADVHAFAYLANFAVDGAIALLVYVVCVRPVASPRARQLPSAG